MIATCDPTVLVLDAEGMEVDILPACPMQHLRAVIAEFHLAGVDPGVIHGLRLHLGAQGFARDAALSTCGEMVCTEVWTRAQAATASA